MAAKPSKTFFFVNKSEDSVHLSQSLASEKSAIQSHVQTGLRRYRKSVRPNKHPGQEVASRQIASREASKSGQARSNSQLAGKDDQRINDVSLVQRSKPVKSSSIHESESRHYTQLSHISPISPGVLSKRDPFDASSVTIDRRVAGLMHYYMFCYHPSQWPNEMALLRKGVYTFQGAVVNIMRTAVADKLAMYSLLAAAACRMQFIDRLPSQVVAGTESLYMQMALQLMATYIGMADMRDPEQLRHSMISIGFLGSAEAYRGNLPGCKVHFDAQIRMLNAAGGLSVIQDEYLRKHLAMADLFLACVYLQPCVFQPWYDPGSATLLNLSPNELDHSQIASTAISLLAIPNILVSAGLKDLILELLESHTVKSHITTSTMSPERAMQVTHWITMRNMAIRNKLLSLDIIDDIEGSLRIALIMWTLLSMNVTGRAKTVKVMAMKLKSSLSSVPTTAWLQAQELKSWMLLVGLYCVDGDGAIFAWFMMELRSLNICKILSIPADTPVAETAVILTEFQRGFFFDVKTQKSRTHVISEKLQADVP